MTSLDDTIISYQNLMLLDNMTNYNKPAIDYFHHKFNDASLEMPASWTLLLKMRKHKLLRLPSCSLEDSLDYNMYLVRLHHCLWRRWSINHYGLQNSKSDPLSINWNKETDVTVLYGPDLTNIDSIEDKMWPKQHNGDQKQSKTLKSALKKNAESWIDEEVDEISSSIDDKGTFLELEDVSYASSVDSHTSSIFDQHPTCTKISSVDEDTEDFEHEEKVQIPRKLKFDQSVMRREIDSKGVIRESLVSINDVSHSRHHRRHHRRQHHHHHHHQQAPRADERMKDVHSEFDSYTFGAIEDDIFYRNQVVF
ncbi:hypothetical protein SMKI_11G2800 [Saccharomyces mikatae IFO 1815]|uniref:YKR075C-like protein n=1 Tax=Saccharomyces mikatae IFO 1815 TaxID=226126 RepID=A0AA35NE71_SACMI|nr:uncharacterized protein SMKI_11G2800 [Saccharomyces mikatae IFO 1815]CAI4034828.1 hypothetical protein SMKI_11G2800 [Saccharomyces mikatae IFO 1815]